MDVVIHSGTKYHNGHVDVNVGALEFLAIRFLGRLCEAARFPVLT